MAAALASLLPVDADRGKFPHAIGIHGDPIAAKERIAAANRSGKRLADGGYEYTRAFTYAPSAEEMK